MRLGIAQSLVPLDPTELTSERARQISALGVTTIMTHFQVPPTEMIGPAGERLAALLEAHGLDIAVCAGLRPNLVTDNAALRAASVEQLRLLMAAAESLGADVITAGCGSHHPDHQYGPDPQNHAQASRARLVACLRELAGFAEGYGVIVAMEPHVLTTLDTPERVRSILDEVDSPWIRANYDPVNFLGSLDAIYDSGAFVTQAFEALGPRVAPCAHIKDARVDASFVLHISEAPPGEGILDLGSVLDACRKLPESSAVIVEHLTAEQVPEAVRYVAALASERGLELAPRSGHGERASGSRDRGHDGRH